MTGSQSLALSGLGPPVTADQRRHHLQQSLAPLLPGTFTGTLVVGEQGATFEIDNRRGRIELQTVKSKKQKTKNLRCTPSNSLSRILMRSIPEDHALIYACSCEEKPRHRRHDGIGVQCHEVPKLRTVSLQGGAPSHVRSSGAPPRPTCNEDLSSSLNPPISLAIWQLAILFVPEF